MSVPQNASSLIGVDNTISDSTVVTNVYINLILGGIILTAFIIFQSLSGLYRFRLSCRSVTFKPPAMPEGIARLWSWAWMPLITSDLAFIRTAGLDALILNKMSALGVQLFFPQMFFGLVMLIPIYTSGNFVDPDVQTSQLQSLTISGLQPNAGIIWLVWVMLYAYLIYAMWLLRWNYRQYIVLRQQYLTKGEDGWAELYGTSYATEPPLRGSPGPDSPASLKDPGAPDAASPVPPAASQPTPMSLNSLLDRVPFINVMMHNSVLDPDIDRMETIQEAREEELARPALNKDVKLTSMRRSAPITWMDGSASLKRSPSSHGSHSSFTASSTRMRRPHGAATTSGPLKPQQEGLQLASVQSEPLSERSSGIHEDTWTDQLRKAAVSGGLFGPGGGRSGPNAAAAPPPAALSAALPPAPPDALLQAPNHTGPGPVAEGLELANKWWWPRRHAPQQQPLPQPPAGEARHLGQLQQLQLQVMPDGEVVRQQIPVQENLPLQLLQDGGLRSSRNSPQQSPSQPEQSQNSSGLLARRSAATQSQAVPTAASGEPSPGPLPVSTHASASFRGGAEAWRPGEVVLHMGPPNGVGAEVAAASAVAGGMRRDADEDDDEVAWQLRKGDGLSGGDGGDEAARKGSGSISAPDAAPPDQYFTRESRGNEITELPRWWKTDARILAKPSVGFRKSVLAVGADGQLSGVHAQQYCVLVTNVRQGLYSDDRSVRGPHKPNYPERLLAHVLPRPAFKLLFPTPQPRQQPDGVPSAVVIEENAPPGPAAAALVRENAPPDSVVPDAPESVTTTPRPPALSLKAVTPRGAARKATAQAAAGKSYFRDLVSPTAAGEGGAGSFAFGFVGGGASSSAGRTPTDSEAPSRHHSGSGITTFSDVVGRLVTVNGTGAGGMAGRPPAGRHRRSISCDAALPTLAPALPVSRLDLAGGGLLRPVMAVVGNDSGNQASGSSSATSADTSTAAATASKLRSHSPARNAQPRLSLPAAVSNISFPPAPPTAAPQPPIPAVAHSSQMPPADATASPPAPPAAPLPPPAVPQPPAGPLSQHAAEARHPSPLRRPLGPLAQHMADGGLPVQSLPAVLSPVAEPLSQHAAERPPQSSPSSPTRRTLMTGTPPASPAGVTRPQPPPSSAAHPTAPAPSVLHTQGGDHGPHLTARPATPASIPDLPSSSVGAPEASFDRTPGAAQETALSASYHAPAPGSGVRPRSPGAPAHRPGAPASDVSHEAIGSPFMAPTAFAAPASHAAPAPQSASGSVYGARVFVNGGGPAPVGRLGRASLNGSVAGIPADGLSHMALEVPPPLLKPADLAFAKTHFSPLHEAVEEYNHHQQQQVGEEGGSVDKAAVAAHRAAGAYVISMPAANGGAASRMAGAAFDGKGGNAAGSAGVLRRRKYTAQELWAFAREAVWDGTIRRMPSTMRYSIVSATFNSLFPDDFDRALPVLNHEKVDLVLYKLDQQMDRFLKARRHLDVTGQRLMAKTHCCCCCAFGAPIDVVADSWKQMQELQEEVLVERQRAFAEGETPSWFVFFKSQFAAAQAAQCILHGEDSRYFRVEPAPGPEEVYWPTLWLNWDQREFRKYATLPFIALLLAIPVGIFTGALNEIQYLLCPLHHCFDANGNETVVSVECPPGTTEPSVPFQFTWYCEQGNFLSEVLNKLFVGWLPSVLLNLWQNMVLPISLTMLIQASGQATSLSSADRRLASCLFFFNVFNVFLGGVLGSALAQQVGSYFSDGVGNILNSLGNSLMSSTNYFLSYLLLRALVTVPLRMLTPHIGIRMYLLRRYICGFDAVHERDRALLFSTVSPRYGHEIGTLTLIFLIASAFSLVSPILLPVAVVFFAFNWLFWRYSLLYVYVRKYESGGLMWPLVFNRILWCLVIQCVFTCLVFFTKRAYVQGGLALLTIPIIIYRFGTYCFYRFEANIKYVPLQIAQLAPRTRVDPWLYVPPPLLPQAVGWHPDWSKPWEGWGMPAYACC